jgi:hypothetical protein
MRPRHIYYHNGAIYRDTAPIDRWIEAQRSRSLYGIKPSKITLRRFAEVVLKPALD